MIGSESCCNAGAAVVYVAMFIFIGFIVWSFDRRRR